MSPLLSRVTTANLLLAAALAAGPVAAQNAYPSKPLKIVLPLPAGNALDAMVRLVGEHMSTSLGQPIVVENKPGAGGLIAAQAVTGAPADGYTLLLGATSLFVILPAQKDNLPIDVNRDFAHVGNYTIAAMTLAVSPKLGVKTFSEFVARAKAEPDKIIIGTNGAGTLPHFTAVALAKRGGVPVIVLPYATGGSGEAIKDVMGGRIHAVIEAFGGVSAAVMAGDLALIGTMASKRDALHLDIQTAGEAIPGFNIGAGGAVTLAVRAGTPQVAIDMLAAALSKALVTPAIAERMTQLGLPPRPMSPAETTAFIQAEQKIWWPIVKDVGVQ